MSAALEPAQTSAVDAACAFSAVPGLGAASLAHVLARYGDCRAALDRGPAGLLRDADALELRPETRDFLARDPDLRELGRWAVAAAKAAGARVVLSGDAEFPPLLRAAPLAPALLYVRGQLAPSLRRVAVVGTRHPDDRGAELAREFAAVLTRAGVQVVSGGALGIDASAHQGALDAPGTTIAVLGTGIDVVYPRQHDALFARIASSGGAVVTELAPGTQPLRQNFPRRNRIIAGLAEATVVVRCALQSGALNTAEHARRARRLVCAVPGDAGDPQADGPNELLRKEAVRATARPHDVLKLLGLPAPEADGTAPNPTTRAGNPSVPVRVDPALPPEAQELDLDSLHLWRLLDERRPLHVDDLSARAQIPAAQALRRLAELELKGMCVQRPGKYFLRR